MRYEIDQSIKIEQTQKDTVIGISNHNSYTVLISRAIKRKLQKEFRRQNKPRLFVYRTFIASVVLLLQRAKINKRVSIGIDVEYKGQDKILTSMFYEMWEKSSTDGPSPEIKFAHIGKRSPAHKISYLTSKGKIKPNTILTYEKIKGLALAK